MLRQPVGARRHAIVFPERVPEIIAVGGGVSGAGDFLIGPLNERVAKGSFFKKPTPVVKALLGNDAGLAGAALFGAETAPHR